MAGPVLLPDMAGKQRGCADGVLGGGSPRADFFWTPSPTESIGDAVGKVSPPSHAAGAGARRTFLTWAGSYICTRSPFVRSSTGRAKTNNSQVRQKAGRGAALGMLTRRQQGGSPGHNPPPCTGRGPLWYGARSRDTLKNRSWLITPLDCAGARNAVFWGPASEIASRCTRF